jgi:plastocyanin
MRTFLRFLACLCALHTASLHAAVVSGSVSFMTKRGQRPNVNETLVWLEALDARPAKKPAATFSMTTRGKTLLPHVMAVPAGSTITFPNEDPISHNLFSLTPGNSFDLGLYRKGTGKTQKFDTPGVVNVYCNVHPNMSAVVHVMPTPYYGFVDAGGNYSFDVPPGRYRLVAWNEQGGSTAADITVTASSVTGNRMLLIDGRNHRDLPHKNKEGQAYRPPSTREY